MYAADIEKQTTFSGKKMDGLGLNEQLDNNTLASKQPMCISTVSPEPFLFAGVIYTNR